MSHTVITIDGEAVTLRPSLRAAYRLEAKHGFKTIFAGIIGGNLTIMADVIELAADYPSTLPGLLREIEERGIIRLEALKLPLLNFLSDLLGMDAPAEEAAGNASKNEAPKQTLGEHFDNLFEIATGWLGWTPADAWAASPAEIEAAYAGRVKLLKAIFGSGEAAQPETKPASLDDKIRLTMAALGAKRAEAV